jgi:surfeit locus 1 family protein
MIREAPRFPVGLTLAAALALVIMLGLAVWQLQRLHWKHRELARIAALQHAPPQPIGPVLIRASRGEDVTFTRVAADCAPGLPAPAVIHMTTDGGDWIARAFGACVLPGDAYDGVMVDRGFVVASRGSVQTPSLTLPAPAHVTGVLFQRAAASPAPSLRRPAPVVLVAETETPASPGVVPAPYAADAADRLQYAGAYAPTWFGLAGALACIYAAMLWRRFNPKP